MMLEKEEEDVGGDGKSAIPWIFQMTREQTEHTTRTQLAHMHARNSNAIRTL